jgi:hypothetical protein
MADSFHHSYEECRVALLCAANKIINASVEAIQFNDCSDNLYIDIVHIKNKVKNPLLIITSGLHGVEGYVGSALQLFLLNLVISN